MTAGSGHTDQRWSRGAVSITILVLVVAAIGGFIVLPLLQPGAKFSDLWDAICSAAGFTSSSTAPLAAAAQNGSKVIVTSATLKPATAEEIGRGATIAQQCAICHGPTGVSRADAPNLSGQYALAIYKQLMDFKTGARLSSVMSPFGAQLSEQDMIDVASYYAYLPRFVSQSSGNSEAPRIVINGAPLRGIAPCGSCHGALDNKPGSPWLEGQPYAYVKAQLLSFASSTRHNDISEQMRNIARSMSPEEIEQAAVYYSGQPAQIPLK